MDGRGATGRKVRTRRDVAGWLEARETLLGGATSPAEKRRVLLVDDEESVRLVVKRMLERAGYMVFATRQGAEAERLFREHGGEIACVLLDVSAPCFSGLQTFEALLGIRSDVPMLLSSGYCEEDMRPFVAENRRCGFLQKPYEMSMLVEHLSHARLGAGSPGPGRGFQIEPPASRRASLLAIDSR